MNDSLYGFNMIEGLDYDWRLKVLGVAAVISNSTGIISITAQYSDSGLTARSIRVALFLKD